MDRKSTSIPLTYGQLSVWRVIANWPRDRWPETYLSSTLTVPVDSSVRQTVEAFAVLCRRHESLRTHFADTPEGPVQRVAAAGAPVHVAVVERSGATEAEAMALGRDQGRDPIDRETDFGRRFTVVTDGGRPVHAVLLVDHIVADGVGLRRLRSELNALLGSADLEGSRWLRETPAKPRELALHQRSESGQSRREAALAYWGRLLDTVPAGLFPVPEEAGGTPGRIEAVLHSPKARQALITIARQRRVSPHTVLLALSSVVTAAATGSTRVVLTLQAGNRFIEPWRSIVSSMNQYAPLPLTVRPEQGTFTDYVGYVQGAALNAYRFASYDFDAVAELVRRERGAALEFDHFYNFLPENLDDRPNDSADGTAGWIEPTVPNRQIGPRLDIKIRNGPDMPIVIRTDPGLLPRPSLHQVLAWYETQLCRLAADGGVPLAEVVRDCERAIDRRIGSMS
ncbi:condensation domain-containing protein [Streptomyces sp. NBC_01537]|uniref:condensation domain-containing protein n=1 Tax=Streptomyces sp. NBC_01537 TaxID=2903896 RepID=UPI0038638170